KLVEATATVPIGLNGEWRELDLGEANFKALMDALMPFWAAAQPPNAPIQPAGTKNSRQSRSFFEGMRDWADQQGRSNEYRKHASGFKYEASLRRDYDAYLKQMLQGA